MRFHGLFIGIDRFASPLVNELTCAVRDADALHALFVDTLGGSSAVVLTDGSATRAAITDQFANRLAHSGADDFVVITFSGHGSDDHYLVTHDADPDDLASTSIHLDELVDLFAKIPARRVLLVLDCCFSGGAGARVFRHTPATRGIRSVEEALGAIAHDGRIILTACDPNQEAIEDSNFGHGLLTWFLMEGLRGAPEVARDGGIPIFALLQYVTQRVTDEAASVGHEQRPTMRGTIDGALVLPVFVPGMATAAKFPERSLAPVSENVDELVNRGVPQFIVDAWRGSITSLNDLQRRAVNEFGVLAGSNLVVTAPTSSGKTMIGELAAARSFVDRKRSLFLLPLRALVADKLDEFTAKYGTLGLRVICATGEMNDDIPNLLRGRYDICLMTYEKAAALLLAFPHVLRGVGSVVVDEAQMLADSSRGANLEFLLTLIKYRREAGMRPQIVLLSAVIGETNGLERWVAGRLLRSEVRPVPLLEGVLLWDGRFRYLDSDGAEKTEAFVRPEPRKGTAQDLVIPLVRKLVAADERVIVFRVEKSTTRSVAAYLAHTLGLPAASSAIEALPQGDPSASSDGLRECMHHGIAFHNADLAREERAVVERAFRERGGVPVLVATTTIAMGVNTPASTVVIAGLEHPGGGPYSVAEYKNMVGRAGRLGFTESGKSMVVCLSAAEEYQMWSRYIRGRPEALQSRFLAADPHLLITRVLAAADKARIPEMTEDQIVGFIVSSFGAFQMSQRPGARPVTRESLGGAFSALVAGDLVRQGTHGYRLTDLGRLAGEGGVEVESILSLSRALRGVPIATLDDASLLGVTQITLELDRTIFPVHRKSNKERDRWQRHLREQRLDPRLLYAILDGDQATVRAKRTAAMLMWTQGTELRRIEASLLQHMRVADAAGAIRSVADRTRDLLPTIVRVAEIIANASDEGLSDTSERLYVQLELGVPSALVPIARRVGTRLTRGGYLALAHAGLTTIESITRMDEAQLAMILGSAPLAALLRVILTPTEDAAPVAES